MRKITIAFGFISLLIIGCQITPTLGFTSEVSSLETDANTIAERTQSLIIDHTTVDITAVPQQWIEAAKTDLNIYYGHTSHGSQLVDGMEGLIDFANNGGLGLSLSQDIFAGLSVTETSPDAGYYPTWVDNTRNYLGTPDLVTGRGTKNPDTNVVIWSWCGQVSDISEQVLLNNYLLPMTELEKDYPGVIFVYMTGHADGSGDDPAISNLHARNQQIRQYAVDNKKVLYDFYDIELYDPDGNYFGNKNVDDGCKYDSDGNGSLDANWCEDWQASHTQGVDWYDVGCAHSESINCNQKAYAAWWMWASLVGWNEPAANVDLSPSTKTVSQMAVQMGEPLTYTIEIVNDTGVLTNTVSLADTVPIGLTYIPGSLEATSGVIDDSNAPDLTWSGSLTPDPSIKIMYEVTVTAAALQIITNTAIIQSPGYDPISRSATIIANGQETYLPILLY